jgi:menaquinol-cytochrome c reductase cytochrome b/c subunit
MVAWQPMKLTMQKEIGMAEIQAPAPFSKSSNKTYSLVELVHRAPTVMVDHGPEDTVFAFPVVALLELLMVLGVTLVLLVMSLSVNAPLEEIANPNVTTDPAKAPWYFMGLQEMLEHGHPTLMAVALPTLMVLFVIAIPYIDNSRSGAGRWFTNPRGKRLTRNTALYALVIMPAFILMDNFFPPRELLRGVLPGLVAQAVIPGAIMAIIVVLPLIVIWRSRPTAREIVMVLFTMLFVSAIIFTLTGFLFRGPGFKLYLPWNMPGGYNPFKNL